MKFTKMMMMLVLVGMFLFGSIQTASASETLVSTSFKDVTVGASFMYEGAEWTKLNKYDYSKPGDEIQEMDPLRTQVGAIILEPDPASVIQTNTNTDVSVSVDNSVVMPAPIMPIPGFLNPVGVSPYDNPDNIWTSSPFDLGRKAPRIFHVSELTRLANPSRALGLFWPEWNKSFKIEIACWAKSKSRMTIRVIQYKDYPYEYIQSNIVDDLTKMGEAHARAIKLHKSERQVMAALCVRAAKQGAKVIVIKSFSNPVTKADTAVLGGAGVTASGNGDVINSAGGFGWATAEKVYRSYVVAELYR